MSSPEEISRSVREMIEMRKERDQKRKIRSEYSIIKAEEKQEESLSDSADDRDIPIIDSIKVECVNVKLKGEMRGMTVVDDQLFIIDEDLAVKVYDAHILVALGRINIPYMKCPQDLAGCSHNKALYICDSVLKCIHRVNLTDKTEKKFMNKNNMKKYNVKSWYLEENYEPHGVSITLKNNVLVTVWNRSTEIVCPADNFDYIIERYESIKNSEYGLNISSDNLFNLNEKSDTEHGGENRNMYSEGCDDKSNSESESSNISLTHPAVTYRVVEYTSDGQVMRDIKLDTSIDRVYRTVQLSSDQFICLELESPHRLCVVNSEGQIILSARRFKYHSYNFRVLTADICRRHVFLFNFKINGVLMFSKDLTFLGKVQTGEHLPKYRHLHFDSSSDRLFIEDNRTRYMVDLSVIEDQMFVVHFRDSFVLAYDSHTLSVQTRIYISDMKKPQGLAGCSKQKALYISDDELKCIHRVNLIDNSVMRWSTSENYVLGHLSLTREHHILVTVNIRDARGESTCRAVEYTSEGLLIRDIEIDSSIKGAWQTFQLSNDQFIIFHGLGGSSLHGLYFINSEGQIIKSYDNERGRGKGSWYDPGLVTMDKNRDHVFVADRYSNRILMFSSSLNLLGQVQIRDHLSNPRCLHFDSSSDRLFIGEESDRVLIICSPDRWVQENQNSNRLTIT